MKTVVFGPNDKLYDKGTGIFYDVINSDIEYHCFFPESREFQRNLARIFSNKATKFLPRFLIKKFAYKVLKYEFLKSCKKEDEILFVFSMFKMEDEPYFYNFMRLLKGYYKNAKYVYYSFDIASTWHQLTPEYVKANFDLVLTFDRSDAEKYGFTFYEGIYAGVNMDDKRIPKDKTFSDVMFVGADKGKFPILFEIFKYLSDKGKVCDFRLVSVEKQTEEDLLKNYETEAYGKGFRVKYKNSYFTVNDYCPYYKTLPIIWGAKCMLDVPLGSQNGSTIRLQEAVTYHKKLITNLKEIADKPYYVPDNFLIFDKVEDIDVNFIDKPYAKNDYDFSPLKMIEYAKNKVFNIEK